jgi:HSP20 family protein
MVGIIRREPLGDLFDDFLKGFFVRPVGYETGEALRGIRLDVSEQDKGYRVLAELPGVKKEDIQVSVEGDQVSISAEVRSERDAKEGERVLHTERYYGKVSRSFRLGQEVDREHVEAKFNNGVLELNLPKKAAQTARQITIQ